MCFNNSLLKHAMLILYQHPLGCISLKIWKYWTVQVKQFGEYQHGSAKVVIVSQGLLSLLWNVMYAIVNHDIIQTIPRTPHIVHPSIQRRTFIGM